MSYEQVKSEINQNLQNSDTPVYEFDENASPTEKSRSIGASIGLVGSSSAKAVVTDNMGENDVTSSGDITTVENPDVNIAHLAVQSAAEIPDGEEIGWKRIFGMRNADKSFQLDKILKDTYVNDLWSHSSVVIISVFTTWFIVRCGGSFGWILVLCAFIATHLKTSATRFYRNAKSDLSREIAIQRLEDEEEKVEWLNEFLRRFWLIYEPVLSATVIQIADGILAGSAPSFLDSIRLTNFTLGSKPAIIESVKSYPKTDDDEVVMDWKVSFVPNDLANMTKIQMAHKVNPKVVLTVRVGRGFVGAGIPILVEDMSFTGLLKVKLKLIPTFPHVETIDLSFIGEPQIDYVLKPIGGEHLGFDIANIPGLASFIRDQVHAILRPMMYHPNVFTLVPKHILYGYPVESSIGVLKLTIKGGKDLRNAEMFGTSDPYCKVMLQSSAETKELSRTKTINNSLSPVWNETYYLLFNHLKDFLKFDIFDSNISTDVLLGSATTHLQSFAEKPDQSNSTVPVIYEGESKGELNFDAIWYPIAEAKENEPAPESNVGILKFNLHQAKELDPKLSMVGTYNPYAEVLLNGKQVHRAKTLRGMNSPIWEEFFEMFITNKKEARLVLVIRDERDFAEDPVIGSWSMNIDEFIGDSNDWFNVKDASSGKIRLSCQWKPVLVDHIPENSGYVEPLGIAKLQIKKVENVAQLKDPYLRILLNSTYRGLKEIQSDNLSLIWDPESFYIPVHSLDEKIYLQCFDRGKDRELGFTESTVKDLVKESDGKSSPSESIDTSAPLMCGADAKGLLFYSASFHPVLHPNLNDINVLEYQSGILVVIINEASFKEKKTCVEIFMDNDLFPVYNKYVSEDWGEVTDVFIKELDFSKITFKIKHSDSSTGKIESNVRELLEKRLNDKGNVWLPIEGMDGCKLNIGLKYIPVKYNVELYESINNMGILQITLTNAKNLPAADRSGTSDSFVKFILNDKIVYESKVLKKTSNPQYNEDFSVSTFSRTSEKFFVKVYDRNEVGSEILIASGEIPLVNLPSFTKSTQKIPLKNEINSTETDSFVTLSIIFRPEVLNKKRRTTGAITNATKTFNDIGNTIGGGVVGNVDSLLKKKDEQVIQEENKVEEKIVPKNEETISKRGEPKTEVVRKPEETKPVNGIKPYDVEFKNDPNQEEIPKQEETNHFKEGSQTQRRVEFEDKDKPLSRSVEFTNVKREQNGSNGSNGSNEENGINNHSKRISTYSINQTGEIIGEPGNLTIHVIEAKDLIGTTIDSYVKVKMNGKEVFKTSVIKKSTLPKWNEQITLKGLKGSSISLFFSVRDRNLLSRNVELGNHELNLWDYIKPYDHVKDIWVKLSNGSNSKLHIRLEFVPTSIQKQTKRNSNYNGHQVNGSSVSNGSAKNRTSIIFGKLTDNNKEDGNGKWKWKW